MDFFENRTLLIATKHQKELIIAPILKQNFSLEMITCTQLDTDQFGTFSGEIPRLGTAIEAARQKCLKAYELTKTDLILASEGSFGADPRVGFIPSNEEILLLKDFRNNHEILVNSISFETNFASLDLKDEVELNNFLERVKFPSHRLILRANQEKKGEIMKGIGDFTQLIEAIQYFKKTYGTCFAETDMRAMYNPTRMKHIGKLTEKLVESMKSRCEKCGFPGFGLKEIVRGLPCEICQMPTRGIKEENFGCQKCGFTKTIAQQEKEFEDPMYCDFCNP